MSSHSGEAPALHGSAGIEDSPAIDGDRADLRVVSPSVDGFFDSISDPVATKSELRKVMPGVPEGILDIFEIASAEGMKHPRIKPAHQLAKEIPDLPVGLMHNKALAANEASIIEFNGPLAYEQVLKVQQDLAYAYGHWPTGVTSALLRDPKLGTLDMLGLDMLATRYGLHYGVDHNHFVHLDIEKPGFRMTRNKFDMQYPEKFKEPKARARFDALGTATEQLERRMRYGKLVLTPRR